MEGDEPRRRGRPAKYPGEGKRTTHTFRVREETRQRLIDAAAESGRSVSEEIEWRVEQSFGNEETITKLSKTVIDLLKEKSEAAGQMVAAALEQQRQQDATPTVSHPVAPTIATVDLDALAERAAERAVELTLERLRMAPEPAGSTSGAAHFFRSDRRDVYERLSAGTPILRTEKGSKQRAE